jgi:hypothetical protein
MQHTFFFLLIVADEFHNFEEEGARSRVKYVVVLRLLLSGAPDFKLVTATFVQGITGPKNSPFSIGCIVF